MYIFDPGMHTRARHKKKVHTASMDLNGKQWWTDFNCLEIPTAYIALLIKLNNQVTLMTVLIHSQESLA